MDVLQAVRGVLDEVLSLNGRAAAYTRDTHLLGALPELDSMAVVALIAAIEDRFGIAIDDEEISGDNFATVGTLADFVAAQLAA